MRAAARVPTKASRALRRVDIPVRGRRRMRKMEVEEEGWEMGEGKSAVGLGEAVLRKTMWLEA